MAYGSGDAAFYKACAVKEVIQKIRKWDSLYLVNKNHIEVNELLQFHDEICKDLENINIMM